ncbi:hypothetical protein IAQ61_010963 [Plenodomus lingam]|uniref:uncharacterized protein n=1 Tax=Leptosphaeria maculans TaxID=5022 RepID=UPI003317B518|nr:hypothetical protein IAQ61_010963 [Plenodomus lingam]
MVGENVKEPLDAFLVDLTIHSELGSSRFDLEKIVNFCTGCFESSQRDSFTDDDITISNDTNAWSFEEELALFRLEGEDVHRVLAYHLRCRLVGCYNGFNTFHALLYAHMVRSHLDFRRQFGRRSIARRGKLDWS